MSKTPRTITPYEAKRLLDELAVDVTSAKVKPYGIRNYLIALLMLDAGLRVGEVVKLLIQDLYMNNESVTALRIRAYITKTKAERIIPMSQRLREGINRMYRSHWTSQSNLPGLFAFYFNDSSRHLSTRQVERIIKRAAINSIGRPIHPHILRHTFASNLMRVTSMPTVQELLGHKHLSSTQIYTHPNGEDLAKAIESLNKPDPLSPPQTG
jgi:integrase/recombinase XerC